MGEFCLLYLLCMLRFPVPLHSLHAAATLAPTHEHSSYSIMHAHNKDTRHTLLLGATARQSTHTSVLYLQHDILSHCFPWQTSQLHYRSDAGS
jgi:hypothetical protein